MAHIEVLSASPRDKLGKRNSRRLRASGMIPAVLYGHGEKSVSIAVSSHEIDALLRHGGRVVDLTGSVTGNAFLKEVQWDPFGTHVLHLDFTRVTKGEKVTTTVAVELRGDAPGAHEGGIVQHMLHEIEIKCPVQNIPEKIIVNVNALHLSHAITAEQLKLPEGAELRVDPESVVVQCVMPTAEREELVVAEGAEPEVIGRREGEEEPEE